MLSGMSSLAVVMAQSRAIAVMLSVLCRSGMLLSDAVEFSGQGGKYEDVADIKYAKRLYVTTGSGTAPRGELESPPFGTLLSWTIVDQMYSFWARKSLILLNTGTKFGPGTKL